jgi:pantoate--beta-alanine ligase
MVDDLNIPVELRFEATVREVDGLAMSSRNIYLSSTERSLAPMLYRELTESKQRLLDNEAPQEVLDHSRQALAKAGFEPQYYDLVDLTTFTASSQITDSSALVTAVRLGKTRLIDNVLLFDRQNMP